MQWPPTPGPGVNFMNPNGFVRRGADHLPDVEVHPLAQQGELVDEGDVDVAEHVLEQLGQLGGVRRRHLDDPVVDGGQERRRSPGRLGVVAPTSRGTSFMALAGSPGFTRSGA